MPEEESEITIGVDVDRNGKPDFTAKIKGKKKFILLCVACYVAGFFSHLGVTIFW